MPVRPNRPNIVGQPVGRLAPPAGQWWVMPKATAAGFPLGQALRLPVCDTDATPGSDTHGTPQDPTTLTLLLQAPGQQVQTLTYPDGDLVRDSQGVYHYDVTPQTAGKWSFRWVATGSFAGATEQAWFLVDPSTIG